MLTQKDELKDGVTIFQPYFRDPTLVQHNLEAILTWGVPKCAVDFILVDDGSAFGQNANSALSLENTLAQHTNSIAKIRANGIGVRAFETHEDVLFNMSSYNLALEQCNTRFFIPKDGDMLFSKSQFHELEALVCELTQHPIPNQNIHLFGPRVYTHCDVVEPPAISCFCLERNFMVSVGAWDEDLSGNYGHNDTDLIHRLRRFGGHFVCHDNIRMTLQHTPPNEGSKSGRDPSINEGLVEKKKMDEFKPTNYIRSPWSELVL